MRIRAGAAGSGASLALSQIADALTAATGRRAEVSADGTSFRSRPAEESRGGILAFSGTVAEGPVIEVRIELARVSPQARGSYAGL